MPKLWNDTIEEHRRTVQEAIQDTAAALVAEHGLASVTMSQIAQAAGIGRATLYKYFPDVETILLAWHERQIASHLHQLAAIADRTTDSIERLHAVLRTYAQISNAHHDHELGGLLHRGVHVVHAQKHLHNFLTALLTNAITTGKIRTDVPAEELASYCLNALSGASSRRSKPAVDRLVTVTLAGLRPPS